MVHSTQNTEQKEGDSMKKFLTIIALLLAAALLLTSCAQKEEEAASAPAGTSETQTAEPTAEPVPEGPQVYGVWENTEQGMEFHLDSDNTGYTVQSGRAGITMSYEIDESRITASTVNPDGTKTMEILEYKLDGDQLTLLTDTYVVYDAEGNETNRGQQDIGMTLTRKKDVTLTEGPLLGVWCNEEQQLEMHLKADGMAYTIQAGNINANSPFEFDGSQFTITNISSFGFSTRFVYEYTLDGDTMTIRKITKVTLDSDGNETDRKETEEPYVFTRKQ